MKQFATFCYHGYEKTYFKEGFARIPAQGPEFIYVYHFVLQGGGGGRPYSANPPAYRPDINVVFSF